jgi:DNA-directed RNA polymerase specialized sigma24 family protein
MPPGDHVPDAGQDLDEGALIERCRAGDVAAFEPLVQKYRQRVWRLAFQVLRDREEAWDCAQDAFVRAFQSLGSFRGQSAFYTWLFRIAMNVATDRLRSRSAQARAFGTQPIPAEEWERTAPDPAARPDHARASTTPSIPCRPMREPLSCSVTSKDCHIARSRPCSTAQSER